MHSDANLESPVIPTSVSPRALRVLAQALPTVQTPHRNAQIQNQDLLAVRGLHCTALCRLARTYNFTFQLHRAHHMDASKHIFTEVFSRFLSCHLFMLRFFLLSWRSIPARPISLLSLIFPSLTCFFFFSLSCRSLWMLAGFAWCSCRRGRPLPAPRPLGPGRLSTRFAFAPTGGSSCPRLAPDPPARLATMSASRTNAY